jgi:hypothetical protein
MHSYSIDSNERNIIPFYIAIISIALAFLIKHYTPPHLDIIPIPSSFVLYGIIYKFFDKYFWTWKILVKFGVIKTPNLNGNWKMYTKSSSNNFNIEYEGSLLIEQSWTKIKLIFEGDNAISYSKMASIDFVNNSIYEIKWEYLSKRKPKFVSEEYMHFGITRLKLENIINSEITLRGDYFTDISIHRYGSVKIKKA